MQCGNSVSYVYIFFAQNLYRKNLCCWYVEKLCSRYVEKLYRQYAENLYTIYIDLGPISV